MITFLRTNKLIRFIGVFVGIQFLYFSIFTLILYGVLSWLHVIFIAVFMSSYAILLYAFKNYLWHVGLYFLLASLYFWSLFNFVYFKVFGNFLTISFSQISTFQGGTTDLIVGFATQVPWYLYVLTILFFTISVSYAYYSVKNDKKTFLDSFDFVKKYTFKDRAKIVVGYVLLLTMINVSGVGVLQHFEKNPKDSWWNLRSQIIDYGIIGHTYVKISDFFTHGDPAFASENPYLEHTAEDFSNLDKLHEMSKIMQGISSTSDDRYEVLNSVSTIEKPNFLIVQLESIGSWAVQNNPSPMPFLRSLMDEHVTVEEFYPNSCETINAEFSSNCSFVPNSHEPVSFSHKNNRFQCVPTILSNEYGYKTKYYHANLASFWDRDILTPAFGFEESRFTPEYKQKAYDHVVFKDALNELSMSDSPFYAYITSFTTHSPHNDEMIEYYNSRYGEVVKPFEGDLNPELYGGVELDEKQIRDYFGFLTATDDALRLMFEQLEKTGLSENTVVLIYNDHRFYNFDSGDRLDTFYKYNKSPFVMVTPQSYKSSVAQYASHIDMAPTILHMVEKENYQPRHHFMGQSLLQENRQDHVINKCLGNIFYINKNMLVNGNYSTQQYSAIPLQKNVSPSYIMKWKMYPHFYSSLTDSILYNNEL